MQIEYAVQLIKYSETTDPNAVVAGMAIINNALAGAENAGNQ